jgi:hypothetical protein
MADRAQVTSVEAIESFRSSLILFLSKARPTLEEVSSDVLRTRLWLQNDQRARWENEFKLRSRALERAQAELFGSRLSKIQTATAAQQMAVIRARRAVHEAEAKLRVLKKWDRELENRSEPLLKLVDNLHGFLASQMPRAVAYLAQVVRTLDAYAGTAPTGAGGTAAEPVPGEAVAKEDSGGGEKGGSA